MITAASAESSYVPFSGSGEMLDGTAAHAASLGDT